MDPTQASKQLRTDYPWIQTPLVVSAPMRLISLADLAVEVSRAGGIGFIGAGTDVSDLESHLDEATKFVARSATRFGSNKTLPIGIGFINWGASLAASLPLIQKYRPAAVWFFAPSTLDELGTWSRETRRASPDTRIWVQVGSVEEALLVVGSEDVGVDVLVVQGTDAGGHGLCKGAGIVSLVPEIVDAVKSHSRAPVVLAAGGICEARGAAAALALGASGIVMGTRFLASTEARIAPGYQAEMVRARDGGQSTVRTKIYDSLRGTTGWPDTHNARGVVNRSFKDAVMGMAEVENARLYAEEMSKEGEGWGPEGRLTTYAGTGVGLVKEIASAGSIVCEVRSGVGGVLGGLARWQ